MPSSIQVLEGSYANRKGQQDSPQYGQGTGRWRLSTSLSCVFLEAELGPEVDILGI